MSWIHVDLPEPVAAGIRQLTTRLVDAHEYRSYKDVIVALWQEAGDTLLARYWQEVEERRVES